MSESILGARLKPGTPLITIRVLLFAQLKDRMGASEMTLSLPSGSTGRELLNAFSRRDPTLRPLLNVSRLAVGQEYVSWDHPLREGNEVAVIPPVSGG